MEELIIRSLQGRATPEEEAQLWSWLETSPENEQTYASLAELWSVVGAAGSVREAESPPDARLVVARAEGQATSVGAGGGDEIVLVPGAASVGGRAGSWWRGRVAVGVLAASLAAVGFGLGLLVDAALSREGTLAYEEVTTGANESATVTLSDDTAVRLGPRSTLRLIDGGTNPVAWLEGRAFFGVVPDPERTFTVRTRYGDATALGTRFEVRTDEEEFRVLVVQGNVRVSSAGSSVEVGEGLMSRNAQAAPPSTSSVANIDMHLSWIGHTLVFRATPLSRVVSEIQNRYEVTVELADDALGGMEVTAAFTDQPVESVLYVVCEIVGARCTVEDGHYRIADGGVDTLRPGMQPLMAPTGTP